ncbi:MAG: polysaccharide biosynthesis/export family protein [Syntrophales bacterium]|nr:polysaccharide biosynthesis/export family protein [Syntrophales bacterium]
MTLGKRPLSISLLILSLFLLSSCTVEAPGTSVKTYREPAVVVEAQEKQQREMLDAIQKMSVAGENRVFKEVNGIPEYKIGPGDVLTINYWVPARDEAFKQTVYTATVRPDGKISFIFGDNVLVNGHTASEVRDILIELANRYMRSPRIEVIVKEYKSKEVLLTGQINALQYQNNVTGPGRYQLNGKTRVLDLIVRAGGVITGKETGNADLRRVELLREGKSYTLNLYNAMFRGDTGDNVVLDHGDMITVPELPTYAERVYVFGQVRSQGILRYRDANDLLTAIALCGGTTAVAVKADVKIIREYRERRGKPMILSANLDEILKQGDLSQNIPLRDGDLVYVPRSVIGDVNEFIEVISPSLDFLLTYPAGYRDAYALDPNKMRW